MYESVRMWFDDGQRLVGQQVYELHVALRLEVRIWQLTRIALRNVTSVISLVVSRWLSTYTPYRTANTDHKPQAEVEL